MTTADEALDEIELRLDVCATTVCQILFAQLEPSPTTLAGVLGMLERCLLFVEEARQP